MVAVGFGLIELGGGGVIGSRGLGLPGGAATGGLDVLVQANADRAGPTPDP